MLKFGYPKGDPASISMVARICNQAGLFYSAEKALSEFEKASGSMVEEEELQFFVHLPETLAYMREHKLDEVELARRLSAASQVVLEMVGPLTTFSVRASDEGISFEYTVDGDVERMIDVDFAITRRLVRDFEDTMSTHLSIGVVPPAEAAPSAG